MSRLAQTCALACALSTPFAEAAPRTFVASYGSDVNPCSLTLPCRGFAAALVATSSAGEIVVLDSAGYGPVTINKGVTITAPSGVYAGITATFGQDAVVVNAPSDYVILRGLDIRGGAFGLNGINLQAGVGLTVENCVISHMAYNGIVIAAIDSKVAILGTTFRLNGQYGVAVQGVSSTVTVARSAFIQNSVGGISATNNSGSSPLSLSVVDSVLTENGSFGVWVDAYVPLPKVVVSIAGTTISGSVMAGIWAHAVPGASALVNATGNSVVQNGHGFWQTGDARLVLSRNSISNNSGWGVLLQPGNFGVSAGDNLISDNASGSTSAPLAYLPLQ